MIKKNNGAFQILAALNTNWVSEVWEFLFFSKLHLLLPVSPLVNQFLYDNVFSGQITVTFLCEIPLIYFSRHLLRFSIGMIKGDSLVSQSWKEHFPFKGFLRKLDWILRCAKLWVLKSLNFPHKSASWTQMLTRKDSYPFSNDRICYFKSKALI